MATFASYSAGAQELPDLTGIPKNPPEELLEGASKKKSAIFFVGFPPPAKELPNVGFFLGPKGFALCPLAILCSKEVPSFLLTNQERTRLDTPVVVAVFDDIELALVKFNSKPEEAASLSIAEKEPAVGTWVALVSHPSPARPLLGPILDKRVTSDDWLLKNPLSPSRQFSVTTSRGLRPTFKGAPYLNSLGEVIAVHYESLPFSIQTKRFCSPVAGLAPRIAKAQKVNKKLNIPLKAKDHSHVFISSSDEIQAVYAALKNRRIEEAKRHQKALLKKFPESTDARKGNVTIARLGFQSGVYSQLELTEILRGLVPGDDVHYVEKAYYQYQLAEALIKNGQKKEGLTILEEINKVYPQGMACALIAQVFERERDFKRAEAYYRQAIKFEPERIDYWRSLEFSLSSQGKKVESRKISKNISVLENLIRTR